MVARDPFTGEQTHPTPLDKDGQPLEPHIGTIYDGERPQQTVLTGYAQGGTTNPPVGEDGKPKHYAPASGDNKPGAVPGANGVGSKEGVDKHFARAEKLAETESVDLGKAIEDNATATGAVDTDTGKVTGAKS